MSRSLSYAEPALWQGGVLPTGIISICVEVLDIKRTNPMRPIGFADDGTVNGV
jgi:hypothetical protein